MNREDLLSISVWVLVFVIIIVVLFRVLGVAV